MTSAKNNNKVLPESPDFENRSMSNQDEDWSETQIRKNKIHRLMSLNLLVIDHENPIDGHKNRKLL